MSNLISSIYKRQGGLWPGKPEPEPKSNAPRTGKVFVVHGVQPPMPPPPPPPNPLMPKRKPWEKLG